MTELLAAALIGIGFAALATLLVRPERALDRRLAPYLGAERARLGGVVEGFDEAVAGAGLLGTTTARLSRVIERFIDDADDDELTTRLRRAGEADARPAVYRMRQVRLSTGIGLGAAAGLALLMRAIGGSMLIGAGFGLLGGFVAGALLFRSFLEGAAEKRAKQMQLEIYTVALALSVMTTAGITPLAAVRRVVERSSGEVARDLRLGLHWIDRGSSGREMLERLARETPEPAVARLYRLLAGALVDGVNAGDSLRKFADQLRRQRGEWLDQLATKRRAAMLAPTMFLMVPVLLLFALAPAPSVLFGL